MTFKARLMAKGYTQRPGVDFEETYSPIAMTKSIRILFSIATWYDYKIWQMDVKMAFLNSFVEEEIFMDQPEGFTTVGEKQKVCRLRRTSMILVYTRSSVVAQLRRMCFIDDILLIGNDVKVLKRFKMENSKRGFLDMRNGVKLSKKQSPKTDEKLKRMSNIPMRRPLEAFNMLSSASSSMSPTL
ncbi:UNVERIFIED_CONTAM: Retrovirus-related Pol polyprotein from transposon RE2 [Sesamum latifolium]|uniref:Retrovirus-related Pol polyprotein from transposon RE2 n=1 Tax=Sesamum latifolium TaxID=2727402 RepID=A0AAW2XIG7_9LAMI